MNLETNIENLKGVGEKTKDLFNKLGIFTLDDLVHYYPRSYEDLRFSKNICDIQNEEKVLVRAVVLMARPGKGFGRKRTMHLLVEDKTGRMEVLFFMAGFLYKTFKVGSVYSAALGKSTRTVGYGVDLDTSGADKFLSENYKISNIK